MATEAPSPKAKKVTKFSGTTFIKQDLCKGCGFCIEFCPTNALDFSREYNQKGYHYPQLTREADCTGCDLCGLYCPDFAIFGIMYKNPNYVPPTKAAAKTKEG